MLLDLQKAFLNAFYQKEKKHFLKYIRSSKRLSLEERFEIYSGSITEGLVKALRENFPVTEKLVGEDFFRYMSYEYIASARSSSPNLGDYGASFIEFVAIFPAAKCLPYLADICQLEWYWQKVYFGTDYSHLEVTKLSQIDADLQSSLVFKRCKNSFLLQSVYPIKEIWEFNQKNNEEEKTINLKVHNNLLLIWRPAMDVIIEELTESQWLILLAVDEGLTLGQLTEQLHAKVDLSIEIPQIVAKGWVSEYELI